MKIVCSRDNSEPLTTHRSPSPLDHRNWTNPGPGLSHGLAGLTTLPHLPRTIHTEPPKRGEIPELWGPLSPSLSAWQVSGAKQEGVQPGPGLVPHLSTKTKDAHFIDLLFSLKWGRSLFLWPFCTFSDPCHLSIWRVKFSN